MLLKGTITATALGIAVVGSAGFMLDLPDFATTGGGGSATLALAPMSLGNPTTAATLKAFTQPVPAEPAPGTKVPPVRHPLRVGRGDTLDKLLARAGASRADAAAAIQALSALWLRLAGIGGR